MRIFIEVDDDHIGLSNEDTAEAVRIAFVRVFGENAEPDMIEVVRDTDTDELPIMVMSGNPSDGFTLVGPAIPNTQELEEYTDRGLRDEYWWYVPFTSLAMATAKYGI